MYGCRESFEKIIKDRKFSFLRNHLNGDRPNDIYVCFMQ